MDSSLTKYKLPWFTKVQTEKANHIIIVGNKIKAAAKEMHKPWGSFTTVLIFKINNFHFKPTAL